MCVGVGSRKGCKGETRDIHPTSKIEGLILRFVGLGYLLICISSEGPLS
jgi:hypothetical protein